MIGMRTSVVFLCAGILGLGVSTLAKIERFKPEEPDAIEVWRITNDLTVRNHANYHNTQCRTVRTVENIPLLSDRSKVIETVTNCSLFHKFLITERLRDGHF